jgi:hypothetical protein
MLEVDVVTIGRPYLLRLDGRHNQAKSSQQVICVYHKPGGVRDVKIPA